MAALICDEAKRKGIYPCFIFGSDAKRERSRNMVAIRGGYLLSKVVEKIDWCSEVVVCFSLQKKLIISALKDLFTLF